MAVLVAGGGGALGAAVVDELVRTHDVVVADRSGKRDDVRVVHADLLDPAGAEEAVGAARPLEAVVNLVGGFAAGPKVGDSDLDDFRRMLELNLVPAFNLAREAMPLMVDRGGGSFVCVSARAALRPFPGAAGYVTAKAGVIAFVEALHAEYAQQGVRSNAVLPSIIDTPANREAMPHAVFGRWVTPAEIARVIRFLVSDDSAPTSGAAVPVYGRA